MFLLKRAATLVPREKELQCCSPRPSSALSHIIRALRCVSLGKTPPSWFARLTYTLLSRRIRFSVSPRRAVPKMFLRPSSHLVAIEIAMVDGVDALKPVADRKTHSFDHLSVTRDRDIPSRTSLSVGQSTCLHKRTCPWPESRFKISYYVHKARFHPL